MPLIGELIGGAAGLYGAAATSYGLTLLGGRSLAIGGYGMAGGIWLIVGLTAPLRKDRLKRYSRWLQQSEYKKSVHCK